MPRHRQNRHQHGEQQRHQARSGQDRTRRVLGQNFLRDLRVIDEIVRAAQPGPDDLIIEVGAGRGSLTRPLARSCRALVAYEIDPDLAGRLTDEFRAHDSVRIRGGDFLATDPPREPFAVVGNIPYASTSRIVDWCLAAPELTTATLVTQLEYARKRCGGYGRWSLRTVQTWPRFEWRLAGRIPRERFRPAPRVDAGILRLSRRRVPALPVRDLPAYERFVALGFSGVGGSLRASLHRGHDRRRVDAALRSCRVPPQTVVAHVWPEQWIALFRAVTGRP
nr:ErmE/ErmH/ErmO/ErmR family 23S rRNA (adenine(2058)-N(6))-methyltransferase [Micromonospora sp. DSM 115978]